MSSLQNITEGEFKAAVATGVVLVDFWAPWCRPCIALTPTLEQAAQELGDKAKIVKMDIDANPTVPAELGIMSIPALVLFKDGKRVDQRGSLSSVAAVKTFVESAC